MGVTVSTFRGKVVAGVAQKQQVQYRRKHAARASANLCGVERAMRE